MANDIDRTSPHYKGDFGSIYEVNKKFPTGGVAGDFVVIEGWAHYWNADRASWCVNAERDNYWDELITNIIEKFKLVRGATYMGVASLDTVPVKVIGAKMYYFATVAGSYKNFGDLAVPQGINVLYSENGSSWVNTTLLEVAQELGVSTKKVVSQKALNDALNLKANQSSVNEALAKKADKEEMNRILATKANTADVYAKFTDEKNRVDAELAKKFDKESVVQESGDAEDKVMSQKAVSDKLSDLSDNVSIKDEEGTVVATPFRYIQNEEFIFAEVDAEDKLLFGIQWDGTPVFGKTSVIEDRLQSQVTLLAERVATIMGDEDTTNVIDTMNELKKFFADIENTETLTSILANLDKATIKDEEGNVQDTPFRVIENEEFIMAVVDSEDKLLFGIYRDSGKPYFPFNEMYQVEQNEEFFAVWLDAANHVLLGIRRDGQIIGEIYAVNAMKKVISQLQLDVASLQEKVDTIKGLLDIFSLQENPEYIAIETDVNDKVLSATYPDGSHYAYNMRSETIDALDNMVSMIKDDTKSLNDNVQNITQKIETISREDVYSRNANNIPLLQSACRYNNGKKDFLMCIITDSHSEEQAVQNAVALTNKIDAIDAIIHCGDITATRFDKTQILNFYNDYKHCEKPWLVVIGNHDVGNTMYLQYSATHEEIFQYYIKPMIDGGILNNGEYQEGKPYYFHDFTDRKIRVIVPYEYDNPLDVADNEYWDSIDYDGSLPQLVPGKTYSVGDKVNSGGYKDNSFICKKEVVTINNQYDNKYTIPYYKSGRTARVIRKEQAEWLVNTLKSTPDEYGVIIATHNPAMINSTNQINSKFAVDTAYKAITQGQYAMETDLISEIVNAFTKKTQLSLKVVMKSANWNKADASYMNILGDTGEKYAYQIEADFSHIQNCYFTCYVGGHAHKDLVFKHDTYESQYGINPVCAITESANRGSADIINTNVDSLNYDALTCISVAKGRIALSRLGNQLSVNGKHRDIEIINI